jgi:hypothetical protein
VQLLSFIPSQLCTIPVLFPAQFAHPSGAAYTYGRNPDPIANNTGFTNHLQNPRSKEKPTFTNIITPLMVQQGHFLILASLGKAMGANTGQAKV